MTERIPLLQLGSLQSRLPELIAKKGAPPWSEAVVLTDDIQAFLICHPPGQPNDTHYHHHDEWWVVLQGEIDWYIEGETAPIHARAGDFVFGPKHLWHHLEPVGTTPSIRVAINARRVPPLRPPRLQAPLRGHVHIARRTDVRPDPGYGRSGRSRRRRQGQGGDATVVRAGAAGSK